MKMKIPEYIFLFRCSMHSLVTFLTDLIFQKTICRFIVSTFLIKFSSVYFLLKGHRLIRLTNICSEGGRLKMRNIQVLHFLLHFQHVPSFRDMSCFHSRLVKRLDPKLLYHNEIISITV